MFGNLLARDVVQLALSAPLSHCFRFPGLARLLAVSSSADQVGKKFVSRLAILSLENIYLCRSVILVPLI